MASYGYQSPSYGSGYQQPRKPPTRSLATAAAGRTTTTDPFGLLSDNADSQRVLRQNATPKVPARTVIPGNDGGNSGDGFGGTDIGTPPGSPYASGQTPVAPGRTVYDINTDPALQETVAFTGLNDQQATAAAEKQKRDLALAYGDENLARTVGGDTLAQAAAQNPLSTRARLGQQRDQGIRDLTEFHNKNNTFYGGARIVDEQQSGQDYQNALAEAAAGVNQGIGNVSSQLAQALAQNEFARIQARQGARDRLIGSPGVQLPGEPLPLGGFDPSQQDGPVDTRDLGAAGILDDPRVAMALAARTRRNVAL
jgi:hypothetical protein